MRGKSQRITVSRLQSLWTGLSRAASGDRSVRKYDDVGD